MARPVKSSFTRYQLTPEEQQSGQILTTQNYYVIQNLICEAAEEKIALTYDPSNPHAFVAREAELQGQIGILKYLLDMSVASQQSLQESQS